MQYPYFPSVHASITLDYKRKELKFNLASSILVFVYTEK